MADLTLLDYAKTLKPSQSSAVLGVYSLTSHVLMAMPIKTEPTGVCKFQMELDLPYKNSSANAYRKFGENFVSSKASIQDYSASIKIAGGRVQADRMAKKINPNEDNRQKLAQVKAQSRQLTKDIFEGAGGSYLYGINEMINDASLPYTNQVVDAAGGVVTLDMLDSAISKHNNIAGSTYMYMNSIPLQVIKKLSRGTGTNSYNLNYRPEEFGVFSGYYDNIPLIATKDEAGDDYLHIDATPNTTIYIVTYGMENFHGFQVSPAEVLNMDEINVNKAFDIEWGVGTVAKSKRCITKIINVKNALI